MVPREYHFLPRGANEQSAGRELSTLLMLLGRYSCPRTELDEKD
jgi:hypothetical protein